MSKTHLNVTGPLAIACHRYPNARTRRTDDYRRVTCLDCRNTEAFVDNAADAAVKAAEAFANQEPHRIKPQFGPDLLVCSCGSDLFRENGRTLDYYHYVCAACGKTATTLTETGMCA